jgi:hypothetical protein
MKLKQPTDEYLEKAERLSDDDAERLLARMRGRFARRAEDNELTTTESLALQLEYEDEGLTAWRERMVEIREKQEQKEQKEKKQKNAKKA